MFLLATPKLGTIGAVLLYDMKSDTKKRTDQKADDNIIAWS